MNLLNGAANVVFDVLLWPFDLLGPKTSIFVASTVTGIVFLLVFKEISWQRGIKAAKDKIKGHMIEIRLYQDDLAIVARAVGKVLWNNLRYLGLNFGPIVPLAIPFVIVSAQLVTRYAYAPIPVHGSGETSLGGEGIELRIEMAKGHAAEARRLEIAMPPGLRTVAGPVRTADGHAFLEFVALEPGAHEIELRLPGGATATKTVVAGDEPARQMQPARTASFWLSWLFPAERAFGGDSPFASIEIQYPEREIGWMPGGEAGVFGMFVLISIVAAVAVIKPLKVQI